MKGQEAWVGLAVEDLSSSQSLLHEPFLPVLLLPLILLLGQQSLNVLETLKLQMSIKLTQVWKGSGQFVAGGATRGLGVPI